MKKENIRVLVAEDDFLVKNLLQNLLAEEGYILISEVSNGQDAITETIKHHPDVILMDLKMPGMGGIEASRDIMAEHPTPIVVLTAYDVLELVDEASKVGVGAYLAKPPQRHEINRAITIAMARFADMMELRRVNQELQDALDHIQTLEGILSICANCKRIQENGVWISVESYVEAHSQAQFSHGLCPDCAHKLYPSYFK